MVEGGGGRGWLKCVEKSEETKQCAHIDAILQSHKRQSHTLRNWPKTKQNGKNARWKTKPTNLSKKFTDERKKLTINFIFHDGGGDYDGDGDGLCLCFV